MLETNRELLDDKGDAPAVDGSVIIPPVSIAPGAKIEGSIIGPHVSIADGVVITHSIIRDSVIANNAQVRSCVLEASLIGDNTVVESEYRRIDIGDTSNVKI